MLLEERGGVDAVTYSALEAQKVQGSSCSKEQVRAMEEEVLLTDYNLKRLRKDNQV
jgi:hypothetical protein